MMSDTLTTIPDWSDSLITLLEQQHALVDELTELADRQAEFIERSQTDALLGLLTQRQRLIDRFTGTQDELARLTGDIESRLDKLDPALRNRIQALLGGIGDRLAHVMHRDEQDQKALETVRDQRRGEIGRLDTARHARQAYLSGRAVNNRFADRRG